MSRGTYAVLLLAVTVTQGAALAQETKAPTGNPVLDERLRNAQVTTKKLPNGATITEVKFAGSLQPNADLDCIAMSEVTSQVNPPALLNAAKKCILAGQYDKAWPLISTSFGYAYYDLKRLADKSTQGARTVMAMNILAELSPAQREESTRTNKALEADPEAVKTYCAELTRIGRPTYDPQWAIQHGIGAYQEPRNGHYLTNVDTDALWDEVVRNRCTPRNS